MPALADSAYVTVENVATLVRALGNDMLFGPAGEVLTDSQPFMLPLLNEALAKVGAELRNHGVNTFTKETLITPITPITVVDPGAQVILSDTGYFDGTNQNPTPFVPTDLMQPEFIWERQTGSTEHWVRMTEQLDGLPSVVQSLRLAIWEWRGDQVVMPGATQSNDLRLRYQSRQTDFATTEDVLYIRDGSAPVAYFMLATYELSKNPELATAYEGRGMQRLQQIATANARAKQRVAVTRRSYGNPSGVRSFIPPRNS